MNRRPSNPNRQTHLILDRADVEITDLDAPIFDLTEERKDPFTLASIVGLGIAAAGVGFGALAVKKAVDRKKAREKLQKEELAKLRKELEDIKNMK